MSDSPWHYFLHLTVWVMPIIALQWVIGWGIFLRNWRSIIFPTLIIGTYLSLADCVAVVEGIWHFDEKQILGLHLGPIPIEEALFFYLISWLVAQSFLLFLPARCRH